MKKTVILSLCFLSYLLPMQSSGFGFGFDDLEAIEKTEQSELLEEAKQAARSDNFSRARRLIKQAEQKAYNPKHVQATKNTVAKLEQRYEERQAEKRRQQQLAEQRRQQSSGNSSVYITSWGHDFSGDGRIWGRNGVKLNTGTEFYTWLERQSYGSRCYNLHTQGGLSGGASNCSDSINNNWSVSCGNSGQFGVQGDHTNVVKAIVSRCGR